MPALVFLHILERLIYAHFGAPSHAAFKGAPISHFVALVMEN